MRHGGVANWIRLRLGGFLPGLLRHRALVNPNQRFAVGAIEDIDPPGFARLGDSFARLPVNDGVEEDDRACSVVVPDIVVYLLEMPDIAAGFCVQCHD